MSTTLYDSPDGAEPSLTIDLTHDFAWFFERDAERNLVGTARVRKTELPAIAKILSEFVRDYEPPPGSPLKENT